MHAAAEPVAKVPPPHTAHAAVGSLVARPMVHNVHVAMPVTVVYEPTEQSWQATAGLAELCPTAHTTHADDPAGAYTPVGTLFSFAHRLHEVAAAAAEKYPAEHDWHGSAASGV